MHVSTTSLYNLFGTSLIICLSNLHSPRYNDKSLHTEILLKSESHPHVLHSFTHKANRLLGSWMRVVANPQNITKALNKDWDNTATNAAVKAHKDFKKAISTAGDLCTDSVLPNECAH